MHTRPDGHRLQARQPERQCIGCGRRGPQAGFLRLTLDSGSTPARVVPAAGKEHHGRGAYLCPRRSCLDRAVHRKAFQRAFRANVAPDVEQMMTALATRFPAAIEANDMAGG